ncbi:hypothetical protein EDD22DRAFT_618631 [Suillus occidentalis]|nr:hypothetical protein EDD22DRAFT_618631 [Suillus occidentalis]
MKLVMVWKMTLWIRSVNSSTPGHSRNACSHMSRTSVISVMALEYQIQFNDYRMLTVLEHNGSSFLLLADNCLGRERRENSSRLWSPTTWEKGTASAMFYRARSSSQ